jgi:formylglycine-generating enzyme required for sulfatase activity
MHRHHFLAVSHLLIIVYLVNGQPPQPVTNSIGQKLVWIKPGKFMMGSPATETARVWYANHFDVEAQKEIEIKRGIYMNCYETTQAEYEQIMGKNPSAFSVTGFFRGEVAGMDTRRLPVDAVTWYQADEFCRKLSDLPAERLARRTYRLPTEYEWEYACRAGSTTAFHYGNHADGTEFNCCGRATHKNLDQPGVSNNQGIYLRRTTVVGSYAPNAWGLYDMHGNVSEYTLLAYRAEQVTKTERRYWYDPNGDLRNDRGGSNGIPAYQCRSASRYFMKADYGAIGQTGFRVVMEIADKK